ncbi:MAG TPA: biotin/lipoyl-containing protein [Anaerolineales bacterium]|nr:biotin/lipoyl-containing protein [Anaerolineales bacterium]
MRYITTVDGETFEVEINSESEITVGGRRLQVDFQSVAGQPVYSLILDGQSYEAYVYPSDQGLDVLLLGQLYHIAVEDERQRRLRQASGMQISPSGELHLKAPMPGLIVAIPVIEGQQVNQGQDLVILESMKMQNELKAPREGTVTRVRVKPGDSVEQNQILVTLV